MKISVFKRPDMPGEVADVDVSFALRRIKNCKLQDTIDKIRACKDDDEKKLLKITLPAYTFAGTFSYRSNKSLTSLSGLCCLDIDKIDDDINAIKKSISSDKHVYACFISPSGNGLKVICRIPNNAENYKKYYCALLNRFNIDGSDMSTMDISRLCSESCDADIYINEDAEVFTEMIEDTHEFKKMKKLESPQYLFEQLIKWNDKERTFEKGGRNDYIFTLCSAMNRVGIPKETSLHLLTSKYVQSDFSFDEIDAIVNNVYDNYSEQFGSFTFESSLEFSTKIKDLKVEAKNRDFNAMVVKPDEMSETLHSFYRGELNLGKTTGCSLLDSKFRFKDNEFYYFVAAGGIGKTTTITYLVTLGAMFSDIKAILVMKENDYSEIRELVVSLLLNSSNILSDNEYKRRYNDILEAEKFFDSHFILLKNDAVRSFEDDIVPFYEYTRDVKGRHIDLIVVDPISGMGAPSRLKNLTGDNLHTELSEFYRDWASANCSLWCISHTNVNKQRDGAYPAPADGLHGGRYHNAAHVSATFHRNIKGDKDSGDYYKTEFRIFKQRSRRMKGGDVAIDPPVNFYYRTAPFGFDIEVDGQYINNPLVKKEDVTMYNYKIEVDNALELFEARNDVPF